MHHGDGRSEGGFKFKVRHLILAAFVLPVMAGVLHMALLSSGVGRRLAALRAAGQPTSLAELALQNKLPMGMENAAPVYESAFAAFVPPQDPNLPYLGKKGALPDRRAALPEPMARNVAACLAANETCLALLHEAAGIATCGYDYDYKRGLPQLSQVRSCAQLLALAAFHRGSQGDADAALAHIREGLRLGESLAKEPFLVSHLVRLACIGSTMRALECIVSTTTFTDSQLQNLDGTLADTIGRLDLVRVMIVERCSLIECMRDPSLLGMTGVQARVFKLPGVRTQGLKDILDHMEDCIEAAGLPPMQRIARFREIETRLHERSMLHAVAQMIAPAVSRIAQLDLRAHAHLDLARTALAIERHRLATGNVPERLPDLVPKYLEQVPIDPFDGQPIRYRRTDPGYVLYSVMDDGHDNGGKEKEDVGRGEPHDLCFIVVR